MCYCTYNAKLALENLGYPQQRKNVGGLAALCRKSARTKLLVDQLCPAKLTKGFYCQNFVLHDI